MSGLTIVVLYIIFIFALALYSRRKNQYSLGSELLKDQYLASSELRVWESIGSVIATEVSALTFLGIPAFAYGKDFSFIHIYLGAVIGRLIIAQYVLPLIYNKGLTLYEIIAAKKKSTVWGRRGLTLIYMVTKVFAVGVRLYAGTILVSEFFQVSIYQAIFFTSLLTLVYTTIGGLRAVVRTDSIQMLLFIGGGVAAHLIIPEVNGSSLSELWSMAHAAGKTTILSLDHLNDFIIGVVGGILFDVATHGMDQDFVQRLLGCRSLKSAQRTIFLSSFFSISVGLLFLSVGALLWVHYQSVPVPEGVKPDKLFAFFITNHFPETLKGFMLAGVLAATMSTLDSTINALSSCVSNDLLNRSEPKEIKSGLYKDTVLIAILLMFVAFLASTSDQILLLGLKIQSWTAGGLLALFATQFMLKKPFWGNLNFHNTMFIYIGNLIMVALNTWIWNNPWQFNVYLGMAGGLIFGALYEKFISRNA